MSDMLIRPSIEIAPTDMEGLAKVYYASNKGISRVAVGSLLALGLLVIVKEAAKEWAIHRGEVRARQEEAVAARAERTQAREQARAERSEKLVADKARWETELQDRREIRAFELERERFQIRRFQLQLRIAMELNGRASGST